MNGTAWGLWLDGIDQRRASRARKAFGRQGRLLSWESAGNGRWRARASCPALPFTVERTGPTRFRAIARVGRALENLVRLGSVRRLDIQESSEGLS